jgi:hypothetical protein
MMCCKSREWLAVLRYVNADQMKWVSTKDQRTRGCDPEEIVGADCRLSARKAHGSPNLTSKLTLHN